jgi:hypothetical protein
MPGRQGRMAHRGEPTRRRGTGHSPLTACPGPRLAGHGRWRGGYAPSARAASLASSAALPVPALAALAGRLDPYVIPYVNPYVIPYAQGWRTPASVVEGICPGHAPSWGQSAANTAADWPPSGGVERPGRVVRFARLIHRPVRVPGGPAVRAACGGRYQPAVVVTQGGAV